MIWNTSDIPYSEFVRNEQNGIRNETTLFELLTYIRLAKSNEQDDFIEELLKILPRTSMQDEYGNIIVKIGTNSPIILFSCHIDMVSYEREESRQELTIINNCYLQSKENNQLGADDGAGIWLMLNMIKSNIPGLYIFHKDEEIGCLGSNYIMHHKPEALSGIKYAIAFDRGRANSRIKQARSIPPSLFCLIHCLISMT